MACAAPKRAVCHLHRGYLLGLRRFGRGKPDVSPGFTSRFSQLSDRQVDHCADSDGFHGIVGAYYPVGATCLKRPRS